MDSFDLGRLTDFDFEVICQDLFRAILKVPLEIFSPGKDGGVDLRHFSTGNRTTIIQCKHWVRSGRPALIRHMEKSELPKIQRMCPGRYILATTVELNKGAKDRLFKLLSPYVTTSGDIYGVDEIIGELRSNPDIVKRHLRLWLSSTVVLQSLLNKEIILRSESLVEELNASLKVYAPSESFTKARDLLEGGHVCVIAGIPGIGKTTLARVLAASYMALGYELVEVSEDAEEINRSWDESRPQFFYYDDFLGQTTLEDKLHKNEDDRLLSIMRKIGRSPNKRFILTTREYILTQARHRYGRLAQHNFSLLKCVLDLAEYTKLIRAEILYNHVYYSDLPNTIKGGFARTDIYQPIINHRNFNPRLIAQSLELSTAESINIEDVARTMCENLDNPRRIWEHIVEYELDDSALQVLEVLFSFGTAVPLAELEDAWVAYRDHFGQVQDSRKFRAAIDTLENTMLRTTLILQTITVFFHNPSVRDFMREHIASQRKVLTNLLLSARHFEQVLNIWTVSDGWQGSTLRAQLRSAPSILEDAILKTFNSEPIAPYYFHSSGWAQRAGAALKIAGDLSLERLAAYIVDLFREEWTESISDGNEIVSLVKSIAGTKLAVAQAELGRVVADAVDWITADTSDWDNAKQAVDLLSTLGDIAPSSAVSHAEENLHRHIEMEMEKWSQEEDYGKSRDVDWSKLDEMVDTASEYEDPNEVFPGYSKAVGALRQHRENVDSPEVSVDEDEDEDVDGGDDKIEEQVNHIMSLLDTE